MKQAKLKVTKFQGSLAGQMEELERDPDFIAEAMALSFAEDILDLMQKRDISQAELADRMGVSPAFISKIFSAPPNLTLKSMAKIALALGVTPQIRLEDKTAHAYVAAAISKRRVAEK